MALDFIQQRLDEVRRSRQRSQRREAAPASRGPKLPRSCADRGRARRWPLSAAPSRTARPRRRRSGRLALFRGHTLASRRSRRSIERRFPDPCLPDRRRASSSTARRWSTCSCRQRSVSQFIRSWRGGGHVDLPRLRGGRRPRRRPDRRNGVAGSAWLAVALAFPVAGPADAAVGSHMAIAEWLIGRIDRWASEVGRCSC